jgi:DnaD/phage-associated family protein
VTEFPRSAQDEFSGFPAGRLSFTPLPNLFFSELLPRINHLSELKVTLHLFWLLNRKKGYPIFVRDKELQDDSVLLESLQAIGPAKETLREGLRRALEHDTFLQVRVAGKNGQATESLYFPNTAQGRQAVEKLRRGEIKLRIGTVVAEEGPRAERPNIFELYEQNIGLLQPMIAEELKEAERTYPAEWIEEAFREAVERNARNWRYIQRILERWATEGKGGKGKRDSEEDRRRYIKGKYADFIKH